MNVQKQALTFKKFPLKAKYVFKIPKLYSWWLNSSHKRKEIKTDQWIYIGVINNNKKNCIYLHLIVGYVFVSEAVS